VEETIEPGYYPDPENPSKTRYWDGGMWANAERDQEPRGPLISSLMASRNSRFGIILGGVIVLVIILTLLTKGGGPPAAPAATTAPSTSTTVVGTESAAFCSALAASTNQSGGTSGGNPAWFIQATYTNIAAARRGITANLSEGTAAVVSLNSLEATSTGSLQTGLKSVASFASTEVSLLRSELSAINQSPKHLVQLQKSYVARERAAAAGGTKALSSITGELSTAEASCNPTTTTS
jgi:hypothetical protein